MAEVLDPTLEDIDHLDFEYKKGHVWPKGARGKPKAKSWCGGAAKNNSGHTNACGGRIIPHGSLVCPFCGVPICQECLTARDKAGHD